MFGSGTFLSSAQTSAPAIDASEGTLIGGLTFGILLPVIDAIQAGIRSMNPGTYVDENGKVQSNDPTAVFLHDYNLFSGFGLAPTTESMKSAAQNPGDIGGALITTAILGIGGGLIGAHFGNRYSYNRQVGAIAAANPAAKTSVSVNGSSGGSNLTNLLGLSMVANSLKSNVSQSVPLDTKAMSTSDLERYLTGS